MAREKRGFWIGLVVVVLKPLLTVFTRHTWRGEEHLPREGGVLIVANHTSMADPPVVSHFVHDNGRTPRFLAKSGLFHAPVLGRVLTGAGQIPVYRDSRDAARAFTAAVEAVREGKCVVVYPEGTVTRDPDLWPMVGKTGAARIALTTGVPVIPLAHWGSHNILAPHGHTPHLIPPKRVSVVAGPPIDLSAYRDRELTSDVLREVTALFLDRITELVAELREEPVPTARFDPRAATASEGGNPESAAS